MVAARPLVAAFSALLASAPPAARAFRGSVGAPPIVRGGGARRVPPAAALRDSPSAVDFDSLAVMDVVLFRRRDGGGDDEKKKLELGAIQEDGTLAPLSAWTLEGAYVDPSSGEDVLEFVVDEEDLYPGLRKEDATVIKILDGGEVGYGSRQVGGGKGPGNPHGEESELLYYLNRGAMERRYFEGGEGGEGGGGGGGQGAEVEVVVNPALEHTW
ncbi:hypothetical protein ACHAWF_001238 [Thalassiosira exigua]